MAQQLERRLVNDYLREKLADKHYQPRVWLGPSPPGKEAREYMVTGRWADIIVFEPREITIIEAKLVPAGDAIGQLKLYEQMFSQTLRFKEYWGLPIVKHFLTTRVDEHIMELCKAENIKYIVFRPKWVEYWEKRRFKL